MDDSNMTMEEYIVFEEEKVHKRRKVFNWQTATYGKIRVDDDLHDLSPVEAEFPAIVINDAFAPQDASQCKSQVSNPVNDEIDFRISFDESDDEDYTIIYDKNSFSYKMIFVNDLKMDSENDYEKVMPLILSPEPAISCFDDLDFFKDFENEFPAIVYNDTQKKISLQGWIRCIRIKPIRHMALLPHLFYLRGMDVGSVNVPYLLARYLMLFSTGRKSRAHISGGQFVARLVDQFGLLTADKLGGLTVIALELPVIDMAELVRLYITPADAEDVSIVDEGGQAIPTLIQAPQQAPPPPPAPARTMPQRMARLNEDAHEIRGALTEQCEVIDVMARDFSRFNTWVTTSLGWMMDKAGVSYTPYYQIHLSYQRRVRHMTRPREGNINEYWWRIYEYGNLEVLES
ncbi:hypothetical protein Tco_0865817 [Tanacetum coccineum]